MIKVHFQHLKFTLAFILVAGGFLLTYNAYAQESATTTTESTTTRPINPRPEERQAALEERVETRQAVRADRQAALSEIRQQRILNLSANISNRMDAAVARLFSVIERLETRIVKMQQTGFDTTAAETKLREAAEQVASARALLSNIDTLVYNATTSEQPLTNWQEVRTTYQEVARLIRASHQSLRETIALLKGSVPTPVTATTTVETE